MSPRPLRRTPGGSDAGRYHGGIHNICSGRTFSSYLAAPGLPIRLHGTYFMIPSHSIQRQWLWSSTQRLPATAGRSPRGPREPEPRKARELTGPVSSRHLKVSAKGGFAAVSQPPYSLTLGTINARQFMQRSSSRFKAVETMAAVLHSRQTTIPVRSHICRPCSLSKST